MKKAASQTSRRCNDRPDLAGTVETESGPRSRERRYLPHYFNPQIAELYGISAALIFQYIWYRCKMVDFRWVALTLDDIWKQYPYLGKKQVWLALRKLVNPTQKTPALLSRKPADQGYAYLYAPISRDAGNKFISFDTRIAEKHGIIAAIIHRNIAYWVTTNWREKAAQIYEHLDPAKFDYDDVQVKHFAFEHSCGCSQSSHSSGVLGGAAAGPVAGRQRTRFQGTERSRSPAPSAVSADYRYLRDVPQHELSEVAFRSGVALTPYPH